MGFEYLKDISCYNCGSATLESLPILNGFTRCTCKTCGSKFLVRCDGSDIVDKYVADRSRVLATFETAALYNGDLSEARNSLKSLVNTYSAIVDIDPIYQWFKIVLLTDNFKDFTQSEEAEREYRKISEYFLSPDDRQRSANYRNSYKAYCNDCSKRQVKVTKKKSNTKKLVLSFTLSLIFAAIIGAFLTVVLYNPVLKDDKTGISLKLDNASYGIFGKYSVSLTVDEIGANTSKYGVVNAAIDGFAAKYEVYEINLYKDGVVTEADLNVSMTAPLPYGYKKECIGVYYIDNFGAYEEVKDVSVSAESVNFNINKLGLYVIAEKKIKVTFELDDGNPFEVQMLEWGKCVAEPAAPASRLGYVFGCWYNGDREYNFSLPVAQDTVLTAHWVRDPKYNGYTYITTAEELKGISSNTSGKYLLLNDINLGGANWSVISTFNGTLDGGCHSVYNFSITSSASYGDMDRVIGFFGQIAAGATVKNLQIGNEGYATKIECAPWQKNVYAGLISGYNAGNIINCRVINCTVTVNVAAQDETYKNQEFASNVGGISGVIRGGTVSQCYVANCNLSSNSESRYNNISNAARCGGIGGYVDSTTLTDCFVENNVIKAYGKTNDVEYNIFYTNKSGQPYSQAGGLIGYALKTKIERAVVYNNSVSGTKTVGANSNGNGAAYSGCMFGQTNSTTPGNLIGVNTTINCSGSNSSYEHFTRITENSFELLIQADSAFGNGLWTEEGDEIRLIFKEVV